MSFSFFWVFLGDLMMRLGGFYFMKNMFILLLVPILNSIFLVLVSLIVQLSYTTFSVNVRRLIKYAFIRIHFFFVKFILDVFLESVFGSSLGPNFNCVSKFRCFSLVKHYFLDSFRVGFFYHIIIIFFLYEATTHPQPNETHYDCCHKNNCCCCQISQNCKSKFIFCEREFGWDGFMMKVLMKMGVVIFLLLMISYISVFGYFMFGIWMDYISIICVAPFFPSSLAGTVSLFDWLMSIVVITISSLVLITSIDYLDILYTMYFLCLLNLFQLFMLGFVLTDSIIIMYVNWDWLGLISYLLINLYFNSQKNGLKAIIFNKLGDIMFLIIIAYFIYHFLPLINFFPSGLSINLISNLFILILSSIFHSLIVSQQRSASAVSVSGQRQQHGHSLNNAAFSETNAHNAAEINNDSTNYYYFFGGGDILWNMWMVSLGLLIVFFTKSAQLPFSSWLINAMAAPTPVSSLLHSSTMVIIGIFLCLLLSPTLYVSMDLFNFMNIFFTNLCGFTLLWSLFKAFSSLNMKSIIAYSTVNQLSYMFLSFKICSLIVLFHIVVHAVFKCMLFLIAGSLIHTSLNFQNIFSHQLTFFSTKYSDSSHSSSNSSATRASFSNFWVLEWVWGGDNSKNKSQYLGILRRCVTLITKFHNLFKNALLLLSSTGLSKRVVSCLRLSMLGLISPKLLYISFLIGSFMLAFALSKELIIIGLMNIVSSSFLFFVLLFGALGTLIYSGILIYFIFFSTSFCHAGNNNNSSSDETVSLDFINSFFYIVVALSLLLWASTFSLYFALIGKILIFCLFIKGLFKISLSDIGAREKYFMITFFSLGLISIGTSCVGLFCMLFLPSVWNGAVLAQFLINHLWLVSFLKILTELWCLFLAIYSFLAAFFFAGILSKLLDSYDSCDNFTIFKVCCVILFLIFVSGSAGSNGVKLFTESYMEQLNIQIKSFHKTFVGFLYDYFESMTQMIIIQLNNALLNILWRVNLAHLPQNVLN